MRVIVFLGFMFGAMGAVYLHKTYPWPWRAAAVFVLVAVAVFWKDIRNGKHNK